MRSGAPGPSTAAILPALPGFRFAFGAFDHLPVETGTVLLTDDLAAVRVAVVKLGGALMRHHLLAAALVECVGPVPQLLGHDGGDGWVRVCHPFTLIQEYLPLAPVIHRLGFVSAVPALIFGVAEDMPDG